MNDATSGDHCVRGVDIPSEGMLWGLCEVSSVFADTMESRFADMTGGGSCTIAAGTRVAELLNACNGENQDSDSVSADFALVKAENLRKPSQSLVNQKRVCIWWDEAWF